MTLKKVELDDAEKHIIQRIDFIFNHVVLPSERDTEIKNLIASTDLKYMSFLEKQLKKAKKNRESQLT